MLLKCHGTMSATQDECCNTPIGFVFDLEVIQMNVIMLGDEKFWVGSTAIFQLNRIRKALYFQQLGLQY